jgi:hypothetical protein
VGRRVVCISSQDGAGASDISRQVVKDWIRLIDEEVIASAAVEAGVDKDSVSDVETRKSAVGG